MSVVTFLCSIDFMSATRKSLWFRRSLFNVGGRLAYARIHPAETYRQKNMMGYRPLILYLIDRFLMAFTITYSIIAGISNIKAGAGVGKLAQL
jgi:hypothetical protein